MRKSNSYRHCNRSHLDQQRGCGMAGKPGMNGVGHERISVASLLAAGFDNRQAYRRFLRSGFPLRFAFRTTAFAK